MLNKSILYDSIGSSGFLVEYITENKNDDWKNNQSYCPLFRENIEKQNLKELEVLLAYV